MAAAAEGLKVQAQESLPGLAQRGQVEESLRLFARGEFQAHDDVVGIVMRPVDGMSSDAVFRAPGWVAVEGLPPRLEVLDGMLDDKHRHGELLFPAYWR